MRFFVLLKIITIFAEEITKLINIEQRRRRVDTMRKYFLLALLMIVTAGFAQHTNQRKWSIEASAGYMASLKGKSDAAAFCISGQYKFTNYLSLGLSTGYYYDHNLFPIALDVRGYYPLGLSKWSLVGVLRTGCLFSEYYSHYEDVGVELQPGVMLSLSDRTALRLSTSVSGFNRDILLGVHAGFSFWF